MMNKGDCKCAYCMAHPPPALDWDCHVNLIKHDVDLLFPNRTYGAKYDEQTKTSKVYIIHSAKDFRLTIRQIQGIKKSGFHIVGIDVGLYNCKTNDYNQLSEDAKINSVIYLEYVIR